VCNPPERAACVPISSGDFCMDQQVSGS
jgi:hypothetical protein